MKIINLNKIIWCIILITVGFNIIFLMQYNFEDDAAFYVTLAQEQLRTGSLFPDGMYYSSGLFVLTPNLLIIPFLLVTKNLILARQLAIFVLWICIHITLYKTFITKNERNLKGFILASSFFSILYVNSNVVSMHFYQGAYISYLLFSLSFLAMMNKCITENYCSKNSFAIILLLYIVSNLGDLRNLLIWGIPGFIAYIIYILIEADSSFVILKAKVAEQKFAHLLFNGILLGFIFFVLMAILYGNYGSTAGLIELSAKDYGESIYHIFVGLFNIYGNSFDSALFSIGGVFKFINFFVAIFMNIIVPFLAIRNIKNVEYKSSKYLILFSLTSTVIYLLLAFLTGATILHDRYLTPVYNNNILLFAVIGSFILKKYCKSYNQIALGIFGVLLYVLLSNLFFFYSQKESLVYHKYGHFASGVEGVVEFLESKGLEYGYASYINSEEYSILSNNKVKVRCVAFSQENAFPVKWLTSKRFFEPDYYSGRTFLMLTENELKEKFPHGVKVFGQPQEIYEFKKYKIFVFDYNISQKFSEWKKGIWLLRGKKTAVYVVDE